MRTRILHKMPPMTLRRWALLNMWDGRQIGIAGRYWTRRGALLSHSIMRPFIRPRDGRASIVLEDQKTGHQQTLSRQ